MIKATKIKMYDGKEESNSVLEIQSIYLTGVKENGFFTKESIYDFLKKNPTSQIHVDIEPNPQLVGAVRGTQKYVRSEPNDSVHDNLLRLPRF